MEYYKKTFEKGDFLKYYSYQENEYGLAFAIFEGKEIETSYTYVKKYSLVLFFDPHKYTQEGNEIDGHGYSYKKYLTVATKEQPCQKQIDTLKEDSWWKICTPQEKQEAIQKLLTLGLQWDENNLQLIDITSGEVIYQIIVPKIQYNGNKIKPINNNLKSKLKNFITSKVKKTYYPNHNNDYGYYHYPNNYVDYYD